MTDRLATVLSYSVLLLFGYLVFRIAEPFLAPLAWSAILVIFFAPLHARLARRWRPGVAALVSTLVVTVFLIGPALVVLGLTAREGIAATAAVQKALLDPQGQLPAGLMEKGRQMLPASLQGIDFSGELRRVVQEAAGFLAGQMKAVVLNFFGFLFSLFLLLFSLFFLFRDGESILRGIRHLLPFDAELRERVMRETGGLIFASMAAGLLIAAIQGTLGGVAFAMAGIPGAFFWGVVLIFFSLVPVVGSALIWVPAAGWLIFTGHWGKGLLVVAVCGGVAGMIDNVLRPLLLRNRTELNSLLLFIGVLGGVNVFGMLGVVIGPVILAAALGVFRGYVEWREEGELTIDS